MVGTTKAWVQPLGGGSHEALPVKGQYAGIHDWRTDGMMLVGSQSGMSTLKLGAADSVPVALSSNALNARFSPDGKRIAIVTWTDSRYVARDIWVLDLAQRTRTRLTFDTTADLATWTPDGRRIAYARYPRGGNAQVTTLWRVAADGSVSAN